MGYSGAARELILLLKFQKVRPAAQWLARQMEPLVPADVDFITAVPLGRKRRQTRGFNQSELIARSLACHAGLQYRKVLRRKHETWAQAGLDRDKRWHNVEKAFRALPAKAGGRRILLLDDVLTTGATLNACAQVLKRAGAIAVHVITATRADLQSQRLDFTPASVATGALATPPGL